MSNILELDKILEERKKQQDEVPSVFDTNDEVTDEEIESIKKDTDDDGNILLIKDIDETGKEVTTSLEEYTADLNEKIAVLSNDANAKDILRLVDNGDIKASADKMKETAQAQMQSMFRSMAVSDNISDDALSDINEKTIKALQKQFNMERLDSEILAKKLKKYNVRQLIQFLPKEFVDLYVTKKEQATDPVTTKEKLIASIAYLVVTGPESDYLNEYIDRENRLAMVSKELVQSQVDFSELLKNDEVMANLVREAYKYSPKDDSFWSKHINIPNRVHNDFAQRVVLYQHYLEGYQKIAEQYIGDEDALKIIQEEIDDCNAKIESYKNVCELSIIPDLWKTLIDRYKSNKKMNTEFLYKEALASIDRVKRCKQDLPFPGYDGTSKKPEIIFPAYLNSFTAMINKYNEELKKALSNKEANTDLKGVDEIHIEGYDDTDVCIVYAMLLLILMGRVLKHYFKNTMTKYDAIMLDSYFRLYCKMGTDIYIMRDFWNIAMEDVKYVLDTWYIPDKEKHDNKNFKRN